MSSEAKPILVTGSHRSGTTWTGRTLASAPGVGYINEPFSIERITPNPRPFAHWFTYIEEQNAGAFRPLLNEILQFEYPLIANLGRARSASEFAVVLRDQVSHYRYRRNGFRPLVKDPIAFFSADWLCREFDMEVLIMLRHPAAFCSSLKLKQWRFPFEHFLDQPLLMKRYLFPFEQEIQRYVEEERGVIEQAILLWNCVHHTIRVYQELRPEWVYLRHEDLSMRPLDQFKELCERFGLEFTAKVQRSIEVSSGEHNPAEQQEANEYVRDSRANVKNWKKRLEEPEIELIRDRTSEIADRFYGPEHW